MMMIVVPLLLSSPRLTAVFLYRQRILLLPCYATIAINFIFYLFSVIDSPVSYFNILCFLWKELLKNRGGKPEINIHIGFENHSYRKSTRISCNQTYMSLPSIFSESALLNPAERNSAESTCLGKDVSSPPSQEWAYDPGLTQPSILPLVTLVDLGNG